MSCGECGCANRFECGCGKRLEELMAPSIALAALFEDYKARLGLPVAERLEVEIGEWLVSRDGRRAANDAALGRYLGEQ